MPIHTDPARPPPIRVTEADYERLVDLADAFHTEGGALLRRELERARVVSHPRRPATPFVRLGSQVEYRDLLSGRTRRVELVLPDAADMDAGRLSVAAPAGAALIGLSAGDAFAWTGADGRPHALIVEWVGEPVQAEAAQVA
jgi:regulator of nucleoside diphosphate kinase